jgi:hypothetical protein
MRLWKNGHNLWILQCENVDQTTIGKVEQQRPTIFFVLQEWQSFVAKSSCNTARAGSSFNQQRENAVKFQNQIYMYNSVLAFTLLGAKVDESVTRGTRPYSFCIHGELYHKIGSMCLAEG